MRPADLKENITTQSDCSYITQITQALYWRRESQQGAGDEPYTVTVMLQTEAWIFGVIIFTFRITV